MLAAAALVKVRQRMRPGAQPSSSSRTTRSVSTFVLPAPALADTHAEARGLAARRCASLVYCGMTRSDLIPVPRRLPATIP